MMLKQLQKTRRATLVKRISVARRTVMRDSEMLPHDHPLLIKLEEAEAVLKAFDAPDNFEDANARHMACLAVANRNRYVHDATSVNMGERETQKMFCAIYDYQMQENRAAIAKLKPAPREAYDFAWRAGESSIWGEDENGCCLSDGTTVKQWHEWHTERQRLIDAGDTAGADALPSPVDGDKTPDRILQDFPNRSVDEFISFFKGLFSEPALREIYRFYTNLVFTDQPETIGEKSLRYLYEEEHPSVIFERNGIEKRGKEHEDGFLWDLNAMGGNATDTGDCGVAGFSRDRMLFMIT